MDKKIKFILVLIIFNAMVLNIGIIHAARSVENNDIAEKLKEIGVFKGSNNGFELEREATRLEGAVMLVRLLGAEKEALDNNYDHPFMDVPQWGSPYIGYLYHYGLTTGVSNQMYGSDTKMDARVYVTFILRALSYDDSKGDFTWNKALDKALEIGLIDNEYYTFLQAQAFIRDDVAKLSFDALLIHMNGENRSLLQKLYEDNVFSYETIKKIGLADNLKQAQTSTFIEISNYRVEQWPMVDYTIDRDSLPDSMRHFTYITIKGTDVVSNLEAYEAELLFDNSGPSKVGEDGFFSATYYGNGFFTLFDDQKKVLGYGGIHTMPKAGTIKVDFIEYQPPKLVLPKVEIAPTVKGTNLFIDTSLNFDKIGLFKATFDSRNLPYELVIQNSFASLLRWKDTSFYGEYSDDNGYDFKDITYLPSIAADNQTWIIYLLDQNDNVIGFDEVGNDIIVAIDDAIIGPAGVMNIPQISDGVHIENKDFVYFKDYTISFDENQRPDQVKDFMYYIKLEFPAGSKINYVLYQFKKYNHHYNLFDNKEITVSIKSGEEGYIFLMDESHQVLGYIPLK